MAGLGGGKASAVVGRSRAIAGGSAPAGTGEGSSGSDYEALGRLVRGNRIGGQAMNVTDVRAVITTKGLSHRYGQLTALDKVDLAIPEGSVYALLGPNGSGKSTLLQILMGLLHPSAGEINVLGKNVRSLTVGDRAQMGYMADGLRLPDWMTLRQLEAYVAPLYDTWDSALADDLRDRFSLDSARKIKTLSRGERMKAALLVSLAPRPLLILLDE